MIKSFWKHFDGLRFVLVFFMAFMIPMLILITSPGHALSPYGFDQDNTPSVAVVVE